MSIGEFTYKTDKDASGVYMKEPVPLSYFAKTVNMLDDSDGEVKDDNEDEEMKQNSELSYCLKPDKL